MAAIANIQSMDIMNKEKVKCFEIQSRHCSFDPKLADWMLFLQNLSINWNFPELLVPQSKIPSVSTVYRC